MNTKLKILQYVNRKQSASGPELCDQLKISRQALNKHIKKLIVDGKLVKEGSTRGAKYYPPSKNRKFYVKKYCKNYTLSKLEEHVVFKEIDLFLNLKNALKENVFNIIVYAFTEMLNNAIEHSRSKTCVIEFTLEVGKCHFKIRDYGIGLFYSIISKFGLDKESNAVGELLKGKRTTDPKRHTGQGIFFTSKAADIIHFGSHKLKLTIDNLKNDVFLEEKKTASGTEVGFVISKNSRKVLKKIFDFYSPEEFDYRFEKTKVLVRLFQEEYVSRSEAKRLLAGLEHFKEIVLDFKGVKLLGQAFCDEIFRVFKNMHPGITIKIENLKPSLRPFIKHAVDNKI